MKHALEAQAALVALASSLALETVEISGADGVIFFDSSSLADLDAAHGELIARFREVAGERDVVSYRGTSGRYVWRLPDGTLRRGVRIVLTTDEHHELLAGAWTMRQKSAKGGRGQLTKAAR